VIVNRETTAGALRFHRLKLGSHKASPRMRTDCAMANSGQAMTANAIPDSREERLRDLGGIIRGLRQEQRSSTVALARACGVSTSLISQVERGLTSPSLDVLWAIARALDVPIGTFFQGEPEDEPPGREPVVVRADHRKKLGVNSSLIYELLSPDLRHQIEFIWVEFGPGVEGPLAPFRHPGEEQMVVIRGEMHFWVDGVEYVLQAGDCITIDASRPHRAGNRSDAPAIVIAAITPPSF
jgi:transcriptional regulator with XRE-family HTH domain